MTPVSADLLTKAHKLLATARLIFRAGAEESAAREAYLAAFHGAQALIRQRLGKVPRTHRGVHGTFHRLADEDPALGPELGRFLARAYQLKDIADYSTTQTITAAEAGRFVAAVDKALRDA